MKPMKVRDVMTTELVTIEASAPIATALSVMATHGIHHLPVVEPGGRLAGVVSDRDLRGGVFAPALEAHLSAAGKRRVRGVTGLVGELRVRDAMSGDPVTVDPDTLIAKAAALMLEWRFSSLPVVEQGALVGIVTDADALRALALSLPPAHGVDPARLW